MALLAAYDIKSTFKFQRLSVFTFGAPRPGNHAFARYDALASLPFMGPYAISWQLLCSAIAPI